MDTRQKNHRIVAAACGIFVLSMLGAAYAAVPLYEMFCRVTGFGGTPQVASAAPQKTVERKIRVRFDANVAPGLCARLHDAWRAGRPEEALDIHRRLMPLHRALFCETSPSPVKYALSRLGRCEATVRLPLVEPSERAKAQVDEALRAAGLMN